MAISNKLRLATLAASLGLAFVLAPAAPAVAQALPGQAASRASAGTAVDSVAAVVNDDVITERELQTRVDLVARRLKQQNAPMPSADDLTRQVLDQMVLERIQLQKAKEDGITVDDAAVQATLQRLARANNMSLDNYRSRIEAQGVPWAVFVRDARTELTLSKLREREVDSKISVSDAEVANYIASQRGPEAKAQQDLRIEHILVKVPEGASQDVLAAAQKKAEEILARAKAGAKFESLAKDTSQAADARNGGDLGFQPPARLPEEFVKASSQLRPGELAPDLIRTADGFEIMRLVDRRTSVGGSAGDAPKLVQTHVRHILVRVGPGGMPEQQARELAVKIRQQVAAGGDFAKFARSYSQDGSASQGGDLGWISPGETVPEFERAMNSLKDGEVSPPVRTEYGYHVIEVLGRRDAPGSIQQQMELARQAIGQRKAEQAYGDWLRQLRDSAYVEYKVGGSLAQQ
ncbi:peptidylprolyl isomerase [Trinickia caryophylli]|uniref:Chaperone SurA n=1 Tax=Trinickia caryophylli TaxID=28094 RepID=A0A1X7ET32_TRICW|nr:peptidylprolyl isomerase [Trinickia caryophylli]WQE10641.1 peptidylprolyl isomerase [Trinickia caryophylli]SMF39639.1 periplasmic chaperone for outer membrane proteins SurA [Trinickia caryophylli]